MDTFLKEQLELLKKLNERVSKIQDDVSSNVEWLRRKGADRAAAGRLPAPARARRGRHRG